MSNRWIDYDFAEHDVRVLCGDHIAVAWDWISTYCKSISGPHWSQEVKPEVLVETALNNLNKTGTAFSRGNDLMPMLVKATVEELDPEFWVQLERLTGTPIPMAKRIDFLFT